jgi:hypothetical protein
MRAASNAKPRRGRLSDPTAATKHAPKVLARRLGAPNNEIAPVDDDLTMSAPETAPTLAALFGVGPDVAGQILATVGDNHERVPQLLRVRSPIWPSLPPLAEIPQLCSPKFLTLAGC